MIEHQLEKFWQELQPYGCKLVPVSKTKPLQDLQAAYAAGNRIFGENKVQELVNKAEAMPTDVEWHFIGHLQRNKVKYIAPFVELIHAVDSLRLLSVINKEAEKSNRIISCLLQIHIASEETKFGFSATEVEQFIKATDWAGLSNIRVVGLMGMATFTDDLVKIRNEFKGLATLRKNLAALSLPANVNMSELSMGMTNDYKIALKEGSTMIRIGTAIFGDRACKIDE